MRPLRRRDLLAGLGAWALVRPSQALARSDDRDDVALLNLALVVEHLEAALYARAEEAELLGGADARLLREIRADEEAHIELLGERIREAGGEPVEAPAIDIGDDLEDRQDVLELTERIENISVRGYLGLLGEAGERAREALAGIYGVEARHAALVADVAGLDPEGGVLRGPQELGMAPDALVDELLPFLPDGLPEGVGPSPTPRATDDEPGPTAQPSTPSPTPSPTAAPTPEPTPVPTPTPSPTPDDGILF